MSTENDPTPSPEPTTPNEPTSLVSGDPKETPPADDPPADPPADEPKPEDKKDDPAPEPLTGDSLNFGEDIEVSEELRNEFVEAFNNSEGSPQERAQALVDLHTKVMKEASEASTKAWTDMQDTWQGEVKADPEIGGANLQPALDRIGKLVTERGSEELLQVFAMTGAGNNVHVIKFLDSIAKDLTEGGPVSGAPKTEEKSAAAKLFPTMKG